jgi:hypothetical protein
MLLLAASSVAVHAQTAGTVTTDANNTLSADRPIIACPVKQPQVKNGARPDTTLIRFIIRCHKGEKPAEKGFDGAVTIDVTAVQVGAPRPWSYRQDSGNGQAGTTVYPVKATYTEKTFYRRRTAVSADWIRVLNFYVNAFGEWQIGSEEPIKAGVQSEIAR